MTPKDMKHWLRLSDAYDNRQRAMLLHDFALGSRGDPKQLTKTLKQLGRDEH